MMARTDGPRLVAYRCPDCGREMQLSRVRVLFKKGPQGDENEPN